MEALANSRVLVALAKDEGGIISTLCRFAFWVRISLGDSTEVSSNEALLVNPRWPSSDRDISMCLKIEGIGTAGGRKVGSIPADLFKPL